MTAMEFLSQARYIDQRIHSRLKQLQTLQELAEKVTGALSDMPSGGTHNPHRMEEVIAKIVDLENEIGAHTEQLMRHRREVSLAIRQVDDPRLQTLLELRYLCFEPWEQIAETMGYEVHTLYRLHRDALKKIEKVLKDVT